MARYSSQSSDERQLVAAEPSLMSPRGDRLAETIEDWAAAVNDTATGNKKEPWRRTSLDMAKTPEGPKNAGPGFFHRSSSNRRISLDVNVARAVDFVNIDPELDDDDGFLTPFGSRRDSLLL